MDGLTPREVSDIAAAYGARLQTFVARKIPDPFIVDEIVADTFVTAWRQHHSLPDNQAALWVWLRETAHNHCRNHVRSKVRRERLEIRFLHEAHARRTNDHAPWHPEADRLAAKAVLEQLSAEDRHILRLAGSDRPHHEVAADLGVGIGAFRMRLHRLRIRVERLLSELL